jgi:replication factor A1
MTDYDSEASDLQDELAGHDIDVEQDDIKERLAELVGEYSVPLHEAKRSILRHYAAERDVEIESVSSGGGGGNASKVSVESINTPDKWVTVEVTVLQLWDSDSDAVKQTGLVGDGTGRIKFTAWSESDLPLLEDGQAYRLENVVTDEYQGRMSIQLNSSTEITELDEDIEAADNAVEFEGAMVDIQSGSGLIKRCPEDGCTRVLESGRCSEHGEQDGDFDLRIKGVLDDGNDVQEVLFDREATEDIADITMERAKEEAKKALDTSVVAEKLRDELIGRYYRVEGPIVGRNLLVDDAERVTESNLESVQERIAGMEVDG